MRPTIRSDAPDQQYYGAEDAVRTSAGSAVARATTDRTRRPAVTPTGAGRQGAKCIDCMMWFSKSNVGDGMCRTSREQASKSACTPVTDPRRARRGRPESGSSHLP